MLQFIFSQEEAVARQQLKETNREIIEAQRGAVKDAAAVAKKEGQANVTAAKFSTRQRVKSRFYRNPGGDPAALVFFNMPFAPVFEHGITISGQPLLWLPIERNLPSGIKSPKQYGKKMVSVNIAGKPPLLFDAQNRLLGPLFVGMRSVTIRKLLDLIRIFSEAGARVPEFFEQRMKEMKD